MTKPSKHDPQWAEAKKRCRLNQDDIAKAKALGFTPKGLMKNIPSPQQQWKKPVKVWIRELYDKKFGARKRPARKGGEPPTAAPPKKPSSVPPRAPDEFEEELRWQDQEEDEEWPEPVDNGLPVIPPEHLAHYYYSDDKEWETQRLGRRQVNLRWAAGALAVALKEIAAVDTIVLFGSVAKSALEFGDDLIWEEPPARTRSRDLDLAIWLTQCDDTVLQSLAQAVNQTLAALAETECIKLSWTDLDLHLLEAETNRFLGCLLPPASGQANPALSARPGFKLSLEAFEEPKGWVLFERQPPPSDDDCPF